VPAPCLLTDAYEALVAGRLSGGRSVSRMACERLPGGALALGLLTLVGPRPADNFDVTGGMTFLRLKCVLFAGCHLVVAVFRTPFVLARFRRADCTWASLASEIVMKALATRLFHVACTRNQFIQGVTMHSMTFPSVPTLPAASALPATSGIRALGQRASSGIEARLQSLVEGVQSLRNELRGSFATGALPAPQTPAQQQTANPIDSLFQAIDSNGDSVLSRTEFANFLMRSGQPGAPASEASPSNVVRSPSPYIHGRPEAHPQVPTQMPAPYVRPGSGAAAHATTGALPPTTAAPAWNHVPPQAEHCCDRDGMKQRAMPTSVGRAWNTGLSGPTAVDNSQDFKVLSNAKGTAIVDLGADLLELNGPKKESILRDKATGNVTRVWGDPHFEASGQKFDFKTDLTLRTEDGAQVTIRPQKGVAGLPVTDNVVISKNGKAVQFDFDGSAKSKPLESMQVAGVPVGSVMSEDSATGRWSGNPPA